MTDITPERKPHPLWYSMGDDPKRFPLHWAPRMDDDQTAELCAEYHICVVRPGNEPRWPVKVHLYAQETGGNPYATWDVWKINEPDGDTWFHAGEHPFGDTMVPTKE